MNTGSKIVLESKFLPFHLSRKMQSLGFDDECFAYYEIQDMKLCVFYSNLDLDDEQKKRPSLYKSEIRNSILPQWAVASPLLQEAEDWLFEKHKLFCELFMDDDGTFGYLISRPFDHEGAKGRVNFPIVREYTERLQARMESISMMLDIVTAETGEGISEKPVTEMMKKLNLLDSLVNGEPLERDDELKRMLVDEVKKASNPKPSK